MLKKYTHKDLTWIDLESPENGEVREVMGEYRLHPLVGNELLSPTLRSRVDVYPGYIYLILHFPTIIHSHGGKKEQEIDFIISKDFIITAHYDVVDVLHEFSKLFEVDSVLSKEHLDNHGGYIFFYMMRHLYQNIDTELERMSGQLADIEHSIFKGHEHEMVRKISEASRNFLNVKKSIEPHKSVLSSFEDAGKQLFGKEFEYYLRAVSEEHYKLSVTLQNYIATLHELRVTNDSLLNTKTNDIMKILTIMAFVTFPLSLFASLFGMNTTYLPFVGEENDFWVIIGIMATATVTFFVFFKYKKWL